LDSTGQHSFGPDRLPNTTIHTALTRLRRQLSQTPAPPDGLRMSKMRQDMMRMQMDMQSKMMEQMMSMHQMMSGGSPPAH